MENDAPIREGYIALENGDTLKGFIELFPFGFSYPVLDTGNGKLTDTYFKDITSMRIFAKSPYGPYIDFFNLHYKHYLWRLDGKRNAVALYDNVLNNGILKMILLTPDSRIKLYSAMTWLLLNGKMDNLLIRFIRKRYKITLKADEFDGTKGLFDYILDRESELKHRFPH
jgi:hypothetical protein